MKLTRCLLLLMFVIFTVNATIRSDLRKKLELILEKHDRRGLGEATELDLIIVSYASTKPLCSEQLAEDCGELDIEGNNPCAQVSEAIFFDNTQNPSQGACYLHIQGDFNANNVIQLMNMDQDHEEIRTIDLNHETHMEACKTQTNAPWGLEKISSSASKQFNHDPAAGSGVTVYMLDSGLCSGCNTRPEFAGRVAGIYNFHTSMSNGYDTNGHGTHVAGTILGSTFGVARSAKLVSLRVFDHNGSGSSTYTMKALEWVQNQCRFSSSRCVVNYSGSSSQANWYDDAWNLVAQAGIPTVVAAGNNNRDASTRTPANAAYTVTVGMVSENFQRTVINSNSGSNYGNKVDIWAPGYRVLSEGLTAGRPVLLTGTSMATPHVAGIVAAIVGRLNRKMQKSEVMTQLNAAAIGRVTGYVSGTNRFAQYICGAQLAVVSQTNNEIAGDIQTNSQENNAGDIQTNSLENLQIIRLEMESQEGNQISKRQTFRVQITYDASPVNDNLSGIGVKIALPVGVGYNSADFHQYDVPFHVPGGIGGNIINFQYDVAGQALPLDLMVLELRTTDAFNGGDIEVTFSETAPGFDGWSAGLQLQLQQQLVGNAAADPSNGIAEKDSNGRWIGIAIGLAGAALVVGLALYCYMKRRKVVVDQTRLMVHENM